MRANLGATVVYRIAEDDWYEKPDGTGGVTNGDGRPQVGDWAAAIVTRVYRDGHKVTQRVDLQVFVGVRTVWLRDVENGAGHGCWTWPDMLGDSSIQET